MANEDITLANVELRYCACPACGQDKRIEEKLCRQCWRMARLSALSLDAWIERERKIRATRAYIARHGGE